MVILGLDIPYKRNLGVCILKDGKVMRCYTEVIPKDLTDLESLDYVYRSVSSLIESQSVTLIGLERSMGGGFAGLRQKLNEFAGVIKLSAFHHGVDTLEVSPGTMKKTITGNGRATKKQMRTTLLTTYPHLSNADEHSLDALSVAICVQQKRNS